MRATFRTIVVPTALFSALGAAAVCLPANAENTVVTVPADVQPASGNNCTNGEIIDGSTAEQALAKFQAAGYSDVRILKKGCDNFWHATGTSGGQRGNIVLSPSGEVIPEGN